MNMDIDWHSDLPGIDWNFSEGIEQFYIQRVKALCLASDDYSVPEIQARLRNEDI